MNTTIVIAILSPILLTTGGIISWLIKAKREELQNSEAMSREFKIATYKTLLEPFIATLTFTISQKDKDKEISKIKTLAYKKAIFDMTTFGSDEVVKMFSQIMQTFFHSDKHIEDEQYGIRLVAQISELLLQIRKDVYSSKTDLKRSDMIEFMLTDIEETRDSINDYKW